MTLTRRRVLALTATTLASSAVLAQSYPSKPIRLVVNFAAGGTTDVIARALAKPLSTIRGQQVVVENRAGASGLIAAETVSRAAADGHTLMLGESGLFIAHMLQPRASLDPSKALIPVAGMFTSPLMVVGSMGFPAHHPQSRAASAKSVRTQTSFMILLALLRVFVLIPTGA